MKELKQMARRQAGEHANPTLSLILSKAMLLAEDDRIVPPFSPNSPCDKVVQLDLHYFKISSSE